ncbi:toprim domain-containing protein (plasmid) [Paenibacillus peoriae]|uniref:Toprim domain-containing protein n=1 Tax=Paenibacillus peoriae TaxID=59893 RepID=A0A7H0YHE0_9BACL|nr:toprim domain-containing protein [Paenibacillus peoriae]QNR70498.1 toprim domain-containing protein [Paenibacillus peoriae]
MRDAKELLETIHIDVEELTESLRFEYQHSTNFAMNPNAFSRTNDTGEWLMSCCPNHAESTASFGISKDPPYHCNCFFCGYLGTVDKIIEIGLGLDDGEGIKLLLSTFVIEENRAPIDIEAIIANGREPLRIPNLDEAILESFRNSRDSDTWTHDVAMAYLLRERGLSLNTISTYEIGVDTVNNCIVFPQRTRTGDLRFLQKRRVGSNYSGAKFINDGSPIKKDILFGLHHINKLRSSPHRIRKVRIVESPIDAMSNYQVGIAAVALNGRILFRNQLQALQLAGIESVDLMLDNDKAGREGQKEALYWLDKAGFIVNEVVYPNPLCKDSNDLLRAGLLDKCPIVSANLLRGLSY